MIVKLLYNETNPSPFYIGVPHVLVDKGTTAVWTRGKRVEYHCMEFRLLSPNPSSEKMNFLVDDDNETIFVDIGRGAIRGRRMSHYQYCDFVQARETGILNAKH